MLRPRLKSVIAVIILILKQYIRTSPSRGPPYGFSLMSLGCEAWTWGNRDPSCGVCGWLIWSYCRRNIECHNCFQWICFLPDDRWKKNKPNCSASQRCVKSVCQYLNYLFDLSDCWSFSRVFASQYKAARGNCCCDLLRIKLKLNWNYTQDFPESDHGSILKLILY